MNSNFQQFCYLALGYNIWHTFKVKSLISDAKIRVSYQSLDVLCLVNTIYVDMMAILAFLVYIKIFKFISFNKTLVQFTTTLKRVSFLNPKEALLLFIPAFIIVFKGLGWFQSYVCHCVLGLCPIGSFAIWHKASRFS